MPYSAQALSPILEHSSSTEEPSDPVDVQSQEIPLVHRPINAASNHRGTRYTGHLFQGPAVQDQAFPSGRVPPRTHQEHPLNGMLQPIPSGEEPPYPTVDLSLPPPPYPGPPINSPQAPNSNSQTRSAHSEFPRDITSRLNALQAPAAPRPMPSLAEALGYGSADPEGAGQGAKPPTYTSLSLFTCLCTCPLLGCVALAFSGKHDVTATSKPTRS